MEDKTDYYESVTNEDIDLTNTEIRVNPNFYIHLALINAQKALLKDDFKTGFLQYRVIVEFIENIADAANLLNETYYNAIDEFKRTEEYIKASEEIQNIKLSHKKLNLITKSVFSFTQVTEAGKL